MGQAVEYTSLPASARDQKVLGAVDPAGRLVALVRPDPGGGGIRPVKVLDGGD